MDADARRGRLQKTRHPLLESLESRNDSKKKLVHLLLLIQRWAVGDDPASSGMPKNIYYNRYKMVAEPGEILVGLVETEFQGRLGFS